MGEEEMLNVFDLEMITRSRARGVEDGLRHVGLVRSATQSRIASVKPMPQMNGLRARVGAKLMGLDAALAGLSSPAQYIEDCQC